MESDTSITPWLDSFGGFVKDVGTAVSPFIKNGTNASNQPTAAQQAATAQTKTLLYVALGGVGLLLIGGIVWLVSSRKG